MPNNKELDQLLEELETNSEDYSSFEIKLLEVLVLQIAYLKEITERLNESTSDKLVK